MNEKFFSLPKQKQQAIINAGFRVFSQNSYQKSPMREIAEAAGISKALLFHYFRNKKELYLFLRDTCAKITIRYMTEYGCYEQADLFEMMYRGLRAKAQIMRRYPDIGAFVVKAYYSEDSEVRPDILRSYESYKRQKVDSVLASLDPAQFQPGLDLRLMYQQMFLASEGYLWQMVQQGDVDVEKMERDFSEMLEFWKCLFLRKEGNDESD